MAVALQIGERCHQCSKWFHPEELHHWPGSVRVCRSCLEKHRQTMQAIEGLADFRCCECKIHVSQTVGPDGEGRMFIHDKDGVKQILCPQCSDAYERKRLDLYADTDYGRQKNLTGAK